MIRYFWKENVFFSKYTRVTTICRCVIDVYYILHNTRAGIEDYGKKENDCDRPPYKRRDSTYTCVYNRVVLNKVTFSVHRVRVFIYYGSRVVTLTTLMRGAINV